MILLGVGFLVLLGVMAGLYTFITRTSPVPMAKPVEGGGVEVIPTDGGIKLVPLFPEDEGADIEAGLKEEIAAFKGIVDGVPAVDPPLFDFLVDRVTSNARVMNLTKEGFDRKADPAALVGNPGPNRGKLVALSGALLSLEREPYASASGLVREIRRGVLRTGDGQLVSFSWPVGNPLEPDPVAAGDGWAQVEGVFYKSWPVKDPAGGGADVMTPHLVLQRRPARDFPPVTIRDVDPAWLEMVHDETTAEMTVRDEDPLFYFVNMVRNLGPDGIEAWAKAKEAASPGLKVWPPEDMTGRYRELLDHPGTYRFRPLSYSGYIAKPSEIHDIRANPGNVEKLWLAFLVDQDFAPALWVFSPRSFAEMGFKNNDRVKVEGFFLKRVLYEPGSGGKMMRAAIFVATRITPAPLGTQPWGASVVIAVVAFMLLLVGALLFAIFQGRRDEEAAAKRRSERQLKSRAEGRGVRVPGLHVSPGADGSSGSPGSSPPSGPSG